MVVYIEDGVLRDIIVDPEVDVEVLTVDEDSDYDDIIYKFWSKRGDGSLPGQFTVDRSSVDVQYRLADTHIGGDDDSEGTN